jgi:hypothetical protein
MMSMIEEQFDLKRLMTTGKLFSDRFEDVSRFAYHGTSTLFADEIEANGFLYPYCAVSSEDLHALADSLPERESELAETLRQAVRPTRLSFAPISYASIDYALTGGGQVVRLYKQGVDAGGSPSPSMQERLGRLASAKPCVYAVDLHSSEELDLAADQLFILCKSSVPASRVVARMLIPSVFDLSQFSELQSLRPLWSARNAPGSLLARLNRA